MLVTIVLVVGLWFLLLLGVLSLCRAAVVVEERPRRPRPRRVPLDAQHRKRSRPTLN